MLIKFNEENFTAEALEADVPVLVDFYADWCGPCKMISPIIDELAQEYEGRVKIGKVDTDANRKLAATYKIMSIPTLLIFKNGEVVDTIMGAVPKTKLETKLNALMDGANA
ncbi:MAG: thioredoxin [Epulopiscium sp. Nuni2H_MBin003]|nr:MAG: thioredoxin [Epulopiscium sp. Nuni2H_MBin003]